MFCHYIITSTFCCRVQNQARADTKFAPVEERGPRFLALVPVEQVHQGVFGPTGRVRRVELAAQPLSPAIHLPRQISAAAIFVTGKRCALASLAMLCA